MLIENMEWDKCKKYKIKVSDVSDIFGYKNVNSFRNTGTFKDTMQGVETIITKVEDVILDNLKK